jgi:catecholate siderophore receptor
MPPGIRLSLPAQSTVNKIDTIALYGFDTLKFNEQWLLNRACAWTTTSLGFRPCRWPCANAYPAYDLAQRHAVQLPVGPGLQAGTQWQHLRQYRHLFAPRGLLWATAAKTWSRPLPGSRHEARKDPSIELGTKWDLLDKKLGLTAAVFRNEVTNVASPMVAALHGRQQGGQRHELGFTGQILSN